MSQYHFWLHSQLHPDSSTYNIPVVFNITGSLNTPALAQSLGAVLNRHDVFKITFSAKNGILKHHINDQLHLSLEQTQMGKITNAHQLKQFITEEITRPFDLRTGPLIRCRLIHLDEKKHVLLIVMHHIITDLKSKELLGEEISRYYNSVVQNGKLPPLDKTAPDISQIKQQEAWPSSQAAKEMITFWKKELHGHNALLNLPLDHQRPPVARSSGSAHFFQFSKEHSKTFHDYCHQHSSAPFIVLLTCYLVLLSKYSRQEIIIIGVPLSNRRNEEDKDKMGCFVNILPLVFELKKEITFLQILHLVRKKLLLAHRHQEVAFHDIVAAVQPSREPSYNPIFQVGFTYEPPMELKLTDVNVQPEKWHNQGAQVDLFLNIFELSPRIQGYFEYNTDIFDPDTIDRINGHFQLLVTSWHKQINSQLSRVDILSPRERNKLLVQWNDTFTDYGKIENINHLFEKQVISTPAKKAVIFNDTCLTYTQLNERANQLANYLKSQRVGPEAIVGVFMDRSLEMVVALYAILKAGGAYVPLEPEFPAQRLSFILEETKTKIVLTQKHLQEKIPAFDGFTISLDTEWSTINDYPRENPVSGANPDNLAYVIYTSGSTGNPKGVMIEHRGLFNRLMWMQKTFQLTPEDKVLLKTPFSFDVSVWEFFWPLFTGASLVVAPPNVHKEPAKLCRIIQQKSITTIHFVPSMLRLFLDVDETSFCNTLKSVFCSGEALNWNLQSAFYEKFDCALHNLYGPTEATVDVSYWNCGQQAYLGKVPIGYPIANTKLYILDEEMQPVPQGAVGELYIGGIQVARGYLQREELNKTVFLTDPFDSSGEGRLYKTGDLVRHLPCGAIEYIGRRDFQVKLFGNRIELPEIETALCRHPLINDAIVTLLEGQKGNHQLVAYLLSKVSNLEELQPRRHLLEQLPYYMVPSHYVLLKEFPLTRSGKVNRKLLPSPQYKHNTPSAYSLKNNNYILLITSIWQNILNTDATDISCNFFDAGGNSLLATEVAIELEKKLGVHIPLVKIFQYPSIIGLADHLKERFIQSPTDCTIFKSRIKKRRQSLSKARHKK